MKYLPAEELSQEQLQDENVTAMNHNQNMKT